MQCVRSLGAYGAPASELSIFCINAARCACIALSLSLQAAFEASSTHASTLASSRFMSIIGDSVLLGLAIGAIGDSILDDIGIVTSISRGLIALSSWCLDPTVPYLRAGVTIFFLEEGVHAIVRDRSAICLGVSKVCFKLWM